MRVLNKVVGSVALQGANAGMGFLNQLVITRTFGLPTYGVYQTAYALLMAAPTFLSLGIFNLVSEERFGTRIVGPSLLLALLLSPLIMVFAPAKVAAAAWLFTVSYTLGYVAMTRGRYVVRTLLASGILNVSVLTLASLRTFTSITTILLVATLASAAIAACIYRKSIVSRARLLVSESRAIFGSLSLGHYALFAGCGILSNLTYVVPLVFAKHYLEPKQFGLAAFGLALARLPFIFSGAISGIIALPVLKRDADEVARLSKMLSTLGVAATALLVLNLRYVFMLAHITDADRDIVMFALFSFVGATLWGAVDDIAWFANAFRAEFLFKLTNVIGTLISCVITTAFDLDARVYLSMVAFTTIISYYQRYRFVNRTQYRVRIDYGALALCCIAVPVAEFDNLILSAALSVIVLVVIAGRVWDLKWRPR